LSTSFGLIAGNGFKNLSSSAFVDPISIAAIVRIMVKRFVRCKRWHASSRFMVAINI
jgi:hypothetical protein